MAYDDCTRAAKEHFDRKVGELLAVKRQDNSVFLTREKYNAIIQQVKECKQKRKKEPQDYRRLKRFDVLLVEDEEKLIQPRDQEEGNIKYFVTLEELFDVLHETHVAIGHGGRNRMAQELRFKYCNVTKEVIMVYLALCKQCQHKQISTQKRLGARSVVNNHQQLQSCCHISVIDMQVQPCGNKKFILVYQDHLTKFIILRALKTNCSKEVADCLLDIFTTIGAPIIIHSDGGREFVISVITDLSTVWKDLKVVQGGPRHGYVEHVSADIKDSLSSWMDSNKTSDWLSGLRVVQLTNNLKFRDDIKRTPYEAMFGCKARLGLASLDLPQDVFNSIKTEEDLVKVLDENNIDVDTDFDTNTMARKLSEYNQDTIVTPINNFVSQSQTLTASRAQEATHEDVFCSVCLKECSSSHFCNICKKKVHDFCGKIDEEMESFGAVVTCYRCLKKKIRNIGNRTCSGRQTLEVEAKKMKKEV